MAKISCIFLKKRLEKIQAQWLEFSKTFSIQTPENMLSLLAIMESEGSKIKTKILDLEDIMNPRAEWERELMTKLESQYNFSIETGRHFELYDDNSETAHPVITAIDGKKYPAPTFSELKSFLTPAILKKINEVLQEPKLLVVPIGIDTNLLRLKIIAESKSSLLSSTSLKSLEDNLSKYFCSQVSDGLTKNQLLTNKNFGDSIKNNFPGWQIIAIDGWSKSPELPNRQNHSDYIAGLRQSGVTGIHLDEWFILAADYEMNRKTLDKVGREVMDYCILIEHGLIWDDYNKENEHIQVGIGVDKYIRIYYSNDNNLRRSIDAGDRRARRAVRIA